MHDYAEDRDKLRAKIGVENWERAKAVMLARYERKLEAEGDVAEVLILDGGPTPTNSYMVTGLKNGDPRAEYLALHYFEPEILASLKYSFDKMLAVFEPKAGPSDHQVS